RRAGAQVRIIAVAQEHSGRGPGHQVLPDGSELVRVTEFDLAHTLPGIARSYRRVLRRLRRGAAAARYPGPAAAGHTQQPPSAGAQVRGTAPQPAAQPTPPARAGSALLRAGFGLYRAVGLAAYWVRAAADGIGWAPDVVHANDGNTLFPA